KWRVRAREISFSDAVLGIGRIRGCDSDGGVGCQKHCQNRRRRWQRRTVVKMQGKVPE
ncbi:hypothetical protein A2U01_0071105, partial [Trifolium medium]|nr:hypothetical protein [Trifolium medium]